MSEWYKITDALPELGERVIATDGDFVGEGKLTGSGEWQRPTGAHWEGVCCWQDLPEAPL